MTAMLPVMLGYLVWLGSLWLTFLGGASAGLAIFGVGALGGGILIAAYAWRPRAKQLGDTASRETEARRVSGKGNSRIARRDSQGRLRGRAVGGGRGARRTGGVHVG